MPRRAVLSDGQPVALFALPEDERLLIQHWTLSQDDLAVIVRRRRPHNRLGFAIQLCALRYPGRLLRPGELIPQAPLAFVAEQLQVAPDVLLDYATRGPTRYEQLDTLRDLFGFMPLSHTSRVELQRWLLPIAMTTTSGASLARLLMEEFRERRIIVPGISHIERMVAQALLDAERHVAELLTRALTLGQRQQLDALLVQQPGTTLSSLSWVRQPPGKPGRKMYAAILTRLELLRKIGLDPHHAESVHPERLRQLCQEGARLTAQHLRTFQAARRHATLVATTLETIVTLTDDAVLMFERLLGQMFRREQNSADAVLKRDRRTINGKIRLLAQLGDALLAARETGDDLVAAVEAAIGWDDLGREVGEARRLIRPDTIDPVAIAASNYPILRQVGPSFVAAFTFGAVPACSLLARAITIMRDLQLGRLRKLPADAPTGFIRPAWRRAIGTVNLDRRTYEFCVLVELRDRLRAGDVWVEGSRRYRAVEQQLIPAPVFAAMRLAGPLPISAPDTAAAWLAERKSLLARRLAEVARKAEAGELEDVQLTAGKLRISPLKAVTPDEAETALSPLYGQLPSIRITDLLAEVDRWTGFSSCFTHLQSGRVADEPRAILTAVLGASIRTGVVSASIMLERLGSYPRANGLALALREIGRVERTLFTLDWIEQPEQRRRATRELNKGEAENALKRAIFFHRIGRIRDHALQAQSHRASALNLVAGAIILWNTTYLEAVRAHLAGLGRSVPTELLQHLSPLGWQHINLIGDYLWTDPDSPSKLLRPLRQVRAIPDPANR